MIQKYTNNNFRLEVICDREVSDYKSTLKEGVSFTFKRNFQIKRLWF